MSDAAIIKKLDPKAWRGDPSTAQIGRSVCAGCGNLLTAGTNADAGATEAHRPHPGGISICDRCGHVAIYNDRLHVVALSEKESAAITAEEWATIRQIQAAIAERNA